MHKRVNISLVSFFVALNIMQGACIGYYLCTSAPFQNPLEYLIRLWVIQCLLLVFTAWVLILLLQYEPKLSRIKIILYGFFIPLGIGIFSGFLFLGAI